MTGIDGPTPVHVEETTKVIPLRSTNCAGMSAVINVKINGITTDLLIDSGAAVTVISDKMYESIPLSQRPLLSVPDGKVKLEAANNDLITVKGTAKLTFYIGNEQIEWEVFVASICDSGILGYDFLYHHDCVLEARQGLTLRGKPVDCTIRGIPPKISLVSNVTVPAYSEVVVQGDFTDTPSSSSSSDNPFFIFEPVLTHHENTSDIVIGRSLIDSRRSDIAIPIRVMNVSDEECKLHAGMTLGYLEEVDTVQEIAASENSDISIL